MTSHERWIATGVSIAFVSLCLTSMLVLPPREGFDENAHYSYISFLADCGRIPDFRSTPLDASFPEAVGKLPDCYLKPPDASGGQGLTYAQFFREIPPDQRRAAEREFWQEHGQPARYRPDADLNWQGQHPPLYYALMAVPYKLLRTASFGERLLGLRLASVFLASMSLVYWWRSIGLFSAPAARRLILCGGVAILFWPSCWHDFGRLGNDSLAALLVAAAIYYTMLAWRDRLRDLRAVVALAVTLGLGLLTKAFFLPLSAAMLLWLLASLRVECVLSRRQVLARAAILIAVPLAISAAWYCLCWQRYGSLIASVDSYAWRQVAPPLPGDSMSAWQFVGTCLRMLATFLSGFLWAGTWSLIRQPPWLFGLLAPWLLLAIIQLSPRRLPKEPAARQLVFFAAWNLAFLLFAFLCFIYQKVRFTGEIGGPSGYYLFVAWPLLGILFARAFDAVDLPRGRILVLVAVFLAVVFELSGNWRLVQVYTGLLVRLPEARTGVGWQWPTIASLWLVFSRLREIALPGWALSFYLMSLAVRIALIGAVVSRQPDRLTPGNVTLPPRPLSAPRACAHARSRGSSANGSASA